MMTNRELQLLEACKAAYRKISGNHTDGGEWQTDRQVINMLIEAIRDPNAQATKANG